jgi:hypothetical protein
MYGASPGRSTPRRRSAVRWLLAVAIAASALASYAAIPSAAPGVAATPVSHLLPPPTPAEAPTHHPVAAAHAATPPTTAPGRWTTPHVAFQAPGPHPQSWGSRTPPGAPTPVNPADGIVDGVNWSQLEQRCYGVWPTRGGQAQYYPSCYGHDEPGLAPYSNLAGSGGNVTWLVTLPIDRSPTHNQSNLYSAVWFGMTLNDPYAWMNQCFLELQFYPDSSWSVATGTVEGTWVAAAVAWQIEASTGAENPCFYAPLMLDGTPGSYFAMTQGDAINVTMTGWTGSAIGENLTITDATSGAVSTLTLYNVSGNYPLDPAYSTNSWSNSLWWTPGGETPVSFAFETGHAGNPNFRSNNSFGGCSPGAPWMIRPPTFFNATARENTTQVGFTQDLGGLAFIDGSDLFGSFPYTCLGHETSAYCSYPWFSFSCPNGGYNFGATDYNGLTTADFGQSTEYRTRPTTDAAGLAYYAPTNFSVPGCGNPTYTVSVSTSGVGSGSVTFLNATLTSGIGTFPYLRPGSYSIAAWASPGWTFNGWGRSAGVTVLDPTNPYTNIHVTGSGTVSAQFAPVGSLLTLATNVTFASATPGAMVSFVPGFAADKYGDGHSSGTVTLAAGAVRVLNPGLYTVQALPPPGFNFTGWTTSQPSVVSVSAPGFPVTALDVASGSNTTVTATFARSSAVAAVLMFSPNAADTVVLNGTNYTGGFGAVALPVGTYSLSYLGAPGAQFETWILGGSSILTNFSSATWLTVEAGTSTVSPSDFAIQLVTLNDTGGNGTITWNSASNSSAVAVPSGTTIPVNVSESSFPGFSVLATPPAASMFSGWSVDQPSVAHFVNRLAYSTRVIFNSTGVTPITITASYRTGLPALLHVAISPIGAGTLSIGFAPGLANGGSVNSSTGPVVVVERPNAGFVVAGLSVDNLSVANRTASANPLTTPWTASVWLVDVAGDTTLSATFAPVKYPVTFVADSAIGTPTASVNGTTLGQGDTVWLPNGTYSLSASLPPDDFFTTWNTSWGRLNVTAPTNLLTTVRVSGPGTLYALSFVFPGSILVSAAVSPASASILPTGSVVFNATVGCWVVSCPAANVTYSWSISDPTAGSLNRTNGNSVQFTGAHVFGGTGVWVNATLNGTTVESGVSFVSVVPALTGVALTPPSASIFSGQSVGFVPVLSCTAGVTCPAGATFATRLGDTSLGVASSNVTYPVTFSSYPGVVGTENVTVLATLNGVTLGAVAQVAVALPLLTSVAVAPLAVTTPVGTSANLTATPACSAALLCPSGATFAWTLSPAALGTLSVSTGPMVTFTAGSFAGRGTVNVSATLNGVTVSAVSVSLNVTASTSAFTLDSVAISPSELTLAVGAVGQFTATPACTPSPCPSGVVVTWSLAGGVGSIAPLSGAATNVTGSTAGSGRLFANATLNGVTVQGSPATVAVTGGGGSKSSSTPVWENPLLWVAVVVVLVVVIAAALLMRRSPPSTTSPGPPAGAAESPPSAGSSTGTPK